RLFVSLRPHRPRVCGGGRGEHSDRHLPALVTRQHSSQCRMHAPRPSAQLYQSLVHFSSTSTLSMHVPTRVGGIDTFAVDWITAGRVESCVSVQAPRSAIIAHSIRTLMTPPRLAATRQANTEHHPIQLTNS